MFLSGISFVGIRGMLGLSEEWILSFFDTDGSRCTVSRINHCFVRKHKQTAADVVYQFVEVASGQIGTADTALKQYIAREHAMFGSAIIYQTAGRVSGYVDGFELCISEGNDVSVVQVFA